MSPRVLFVDHVGELGGAELALLDTATHYGERCRVVLLQDGPFKERLIEQGVEVKVIEAMPAIAGVSRGSRAWRDILAIPGLFKLAWLLVGEAKTADLLYANSQKAMLVCALAGFLARKPVIWHLHDVLSVEHFSKHHLRIATGTANRLVAKVIANSEATRIAFVAAGGRPHRVCVVYNGFDPEPFDAITESDVRRLSVESGFQNTKLVGIFGRLTHWKGQHVLVEAISSLPDVHAIIVGGALFQDDHAYEERLRLLIQRLGVEDRVHFMGFRSDVPALMKMVDVVVHASIAPEPFGRVIVEGMLANRPVVASAAGGALEIIESGRTGILVPPSDSTALQIALHRLLASREYASGLASEGNTVARKAFSQARMIAGVRSVVRSVHENK